MSKGVHILLFTFMYKICIKIKHIRQLMKNQQNRSNYSKIYVS